MQPHLGCQSADQSAALEGMSALPRHPDMPPTTADGKSEPFHDRLLPNQARSFRGISTLRAFMRRPSFRRCPFQAISRARGEQCRWRYGAQRGKCSKPSRTFRWRALFVYWSSRQATVRPREPSALTWDLAFGSRVLTRHWVWVLVWSVAAQAVSSILMRADC